MNRPFPELPQYQFEYQSSLVVPQSSQIQMQSLTNLYTPMSHAYGTVRTQHARSVEISNVNPHCPDVEQQQLLNDCTRASPDVESEYEVGEDVPLINVLEEEDGVDQHMPGVGPTVHSDSF